MLVLLRGSDALMRRARRRRRGDVCRRDRGSDRLTVDRLRRHLPVFEYGDGLDSVGYFTFRRYAIAVDHFVRGHRLGNVRCRHSAAATHAAAVGQLLKRTRERAAQRHCEWKAAKEARLLASGAAEKRRKEIILRLMKRLKGIVSAKKLPEDIERITESEATKAVVTTTTKRIHIK